MKIMNMVYYLGRTIIWSSAIGLMLSISGCIKEVPLEMQCRIVFRISNQDQINKIVTDVVRASESDGLAVVGPSEIINQSIMRRSIEIISENKQSRIWNNESHFVFIFHIVDDVAEISVHNGYGQVAQDGRKKGRIFFDKILKIAKDDIPTLKENQCVVMNDPVPPIVGDQQGKDKEGTHPQLEFREFKAIESKGSNR